MATLAVQYILAVFYFLKDSVQFKSQRPSTPVSRQNSTNPIPRLKTILIVPYYSPSYKSKYGTQRIFKLADYLSKNDWQVNMLASTPRHDYEKSDDESGADSVVNVLRLRSILQYPLVDRHLVVPDDFMFWYADNRREAVKLAKTIKPDIVLSTLPPYTNSLIALAAANGVKAPMVVDFRDPWSKESTCWRPRSGLQKYVTALFEKRISQRSAES